MVDMALAEHIIMALQGDGLPLYLLPTPDNPRPAPGFLVAPFREGRAWVLWYPPDQGAQAVQEGLTRCLRAIEANTDLVATWTADRTGLEVYPRAPDGLLSGLA